LLDRIELYRVGKKEKTCGSQQKGKAYKIEITGTLPAWKEIIILGGKR
jgi:hypothetical protein